MQLMKSKKGVAELGGATKALGVVAIVAAVVVLILETLGSSITSGNGSLIVGYGISAIVQIAKMLVLVALIIIAVYVLRLVNII